VKKIPSEQKERLSQTLGVLENFLSNKWFAGDEITIADISILATVSTVKVSCKILRNK
jgi:glutathione S-transferase